MDDIVNEFITETTEGLAVIDQELVKLEKEPTNLNIVGTIFRVMHTIKGACGFLSLHRLEKVAHAGENMLGKFRDGELDVTPHAITLIFRSTDRIRAIIEEISQNGKELEGDDTDVIRQVEDFINNKTSEPAEEAEDMTCFFKGDDDLEAMIQELEAAKPKPLQVVPKKEAVVAEVKTEAKAEAKTEPKENNPANQSIRVNIDILEKMMQMVGELVLARNQLLQVARTQEDQTFLPPLQQLSHITTELQESVMKTRMQPIGSAWQKFPRLVRDLSHELGKKIELKMIGEDTELDRQLLEAVKDPLTHMVRNSCDHGVEAPEDRKEKNKPETGTITLNAYHDGGHIVIDISDDGKGIDHERVKEKVISQGLATASELASMTDRQILQFIFAPGFSTASQVTAVSGRGVGMDVVKTNVEKIGGTIDLFSTPGEGSRISIKIPLTLAIVSVLIVETNGQSFAIPQINVRELIQTGAGFPTAVEEVNNAKVIRLRDSLLPVISLASTLKLDDTAHKPESFIVVCSVGGNDFGLMVEHIHNIEEIVVKPVCRAIKSVPLFTGNTILGDGSVIMILDPGNLAKAAGELKPSEDALAAANAETQAQDKMVNFLLFDYGQKKKAIPLELVWRLEEANAGHIEYSNGNAVLQYRGQLMKMLTLDDELLIPQSGSFPVIVFQYDDRIYGLPVTQINDIMNVPLRLQMSSQNSNYVGSMVIDFRTTDIIDVANLLATNLGKPIENNLPKSSGTLLLVDDSPFFLKMTVPILTEAGYSVLTSESGEAALKLLEQEKVDLIITDIIMPEMNGYIFAEICSKTPHIANVPVIGCTSTMNPEVLAKSQACKMAACVPKSNRTELLAVINRTYSGKEVAA